MSTGINVIIDIVSIVVLLMTAAAKFFGKTPRNPLRSLFGFMLAVLAAILLTDAFMWMFNGAAYKGCSHVSYAVNTLRYIAEIAYCYLWLAFADYWSLRSVKHVKRRLLLFAIPAMAEVVILVCNLFTGWVFYIDAANRYITGEYYSVNLIAFYIYIAGTLILAFTGWIRAQNDTARRRSLNLVVYMLLPIFGMLAQALSKGVSWIWAFSTISLLLIFLDEQRQNQTEEQVRAARLEAELSQSRIAVTLSRIQPHFLFNSLSTIRYLCDGNPKAAGEAIEHFVNFLRANMDSLTAEELVSFSREREHVENYLFLEKLRFEDRLRVEYDIQCSSFLLPTLTLQPMVENAVRYGVTKREGGGCIKISTRETDEGFAVIVEDDGVGFDVHEKKNDGRSHVGIENVRSRLALQCGGSLEIESRQGSGTRVKMTVPKSCGRPPENKA